MAIFTVTDTELVTRFLFFGREDGAYFATNGSNQIDKHSASINRLIQEGKGRDVVDLIKRISIEGRAPKQGPLLYALALCARCDDKLTKNAAYRSLAEVCRLPTHLFQFIKYAEELSGETSGWGRAQRKAVSHWYNQPSFQRNPMKLLRLGSKYRRRHTFSHQDVIRLGHVKPEGPHSAFAIRYLAKGKENVEDIDKSDGMISNAYLFVLALEKAKTCSPNDTSLLCQLIKDHELSHQHLPTTFLTSAEVWRSLIYTMPLNALLRHLGKLSKLHLLDNGSMEEAHVIGRLENVENLRFARIHPFTLLTAWNSYRRGHSGPKKRLTWTVNQKIADGLETAFYKSFASVEPIKKRILIAVDGSKAMMQPANGMKEVSARSTAVPMAFILSKMEDNAEVILVKEQLIPVNLDQSDNLEIASQKFSINGTSDYCDPCKPMNWARENKMKFDAIVFFTASLAFNNNENPSTAMRQYREELGIPRARLVNVGMASNEFTVTDQTDADVLNVVGLDSNILTIISDFVRR